MGSSLDCLAYIIVPVLYRRTFGFAIGLVSICLITLSVNHVSYALYANRLLTNTLRHSIKTDISQIKMTVLKQFNLIDPIALLELCLLDVSMDTLC